jgi:hypothetical protein
MTRDERIQQLLDKADIEAVLYKWGSGVARREWEEVRSVFHDDAMDAHGTFDGGIDQFVEWQKRHHEHIELSVHFIGSVQVQFAKPDLALSQAYVIAFHRYGKDAGHARQDIFGAHTAEHAKPMQSILVGRYIDRFERRGGPWKIAKRVTVYEWARLEDAPWEIPFQANWTRAKRDKTDPIYAMRKEVGITD